MYYSLRPFDQLPVRPRPHDLQRTKARSGKSGWARCFGVATGIRPTLKWFKTFLELPNGVPSHDTFGKVFAALDLKHSPGKHWSF